MKSNIKFSIVVISLNTLNDFKETISSIYKQKYNNFDAKDMHIKITSQNIAYNCELDNYNNYIPLRNTAYNHTHHIRNKSSQS